MRQRSAGASGAVRRDCHQPIARKIGAASSMRSVITMTASTW